MEAAQGKQSELGANSNAPAAATFSSAENPTGSVSVSSASSTLSAVTSSPIPIMPAVGVANPSHAVVSGPSTFPFAHSPGVVANIGQPPPTMVTQLNVAVSGSIGASPSPISANTSIMYGTLAFLVSNDLM